jgi:sterol 3beta-glucosyltransferase
MNISLLTYGTRGDVQPLAALAVGLRQAGHTVRLAAPQRFADLAAQHAIPFAPLPGDPEALSRGLNEARGPLAQIRSVSRFAFDIAGDVARAAFAACDDADLIVHSLLFTTGAHSLARLKGLPDVSVQGMPLFAPTRRFPLPAMPGLPPGPLSYASHVFFTQVFWHMGNWGYAGLRRTHPDVAGMKLHWPFDRRNPHPTPLLFAYSPSVLPRPDDWSAPSVHVCGYLFLDAPAGYQPPSALADFLAAGEPPVCVTFGSMVNRLAGRLHEAALAALKQTGQRAVIVRGWGTALPDHPDRDLLYFDASPLFLVDDAPYDWLFPRCKLIVHHGGAGTTASALRAGAPSVVLPHAADQAFWGRRVAALGAGPRPIPVKRATAAALAAALREASGPGMRACAQDVARKIAAEDGVGECVRWVERALR